MPRPRLEGARWPGDGPPVAVVVAGATAFAAAALYVHGGFAVGLAPLLGVALFMAAIAGFLAVPWLTIALAIPFFTVLPTLKFFVNSDLGPAKDLLVIAAFVAMAIGALQRRSAGVAPRVDRWVAGSILLLLTLYVVNAAGDHNLAWFHATRLVAEPLVLLLVGLTVDQPRRCLRWATLSLVLTAVPVAVYGLIQQALGPEGLVSLGYLYGIQVRTIDGSLRSFGTLDEPFAYAAFLLLAVAAVLAWRRRGTLSVVCFGILAAGLAVSYVRTALVIAVALVAMLLLRKGLRTLAFAVAVTAAVIGLNILITSDHASQTKSVNQGGPLITLNGRTDVWGTALGGSSNWILGRGVGVVGTGEERASFGVSRNIDAAKVESRSRDFAQVDSAYLSVVADVGFVGLAVLLVLLGRLVGLARAEIRRGDPAGWLAAGFLLVMLADGLTRASFIAFPNAFLGMLLIGLALAAGVRPDRDEPAPARSPAERQPVHAA